MTTTKEPAWTATGKLSLAEVLAGSSPAAPRNHYDSLPTTAVAPEPKTPYWEWTC